MAQWSRICLPMHLGAIPGWGRSPGEGNGTNRPTSVLEHSGLLSQPPWNQEPSTKGSISASGLSQTSQPAMSGTSPTYQQSDSRSRTSSPTNIHPKISFHDAATTSPRIPQGSAASCLVTQPQPTVMGILHTRQGLPTN